MKSGHLLAFSLIVLGTIVGLSGTDLVLPAIPTLANHLPGSLALSQMVLASFAAGTGVGLMVFGELGGRLSQHRILLVALFMYGTLSLVAALVTSMMELVAIRFFQGFFAAAPAVFAPGMIRALFDDRQAMRAIGLMGSLESIVPAFAPILGAWLVSQFHWQATFYATAAGAFTLFICWLFNRPPESPKAEAGHGSYLALFQIPEFLRYAISQALTLGGLIAFVFGAPTVIIHSMDGSLSDFITMQIIGIALFMIAANTSHLISDRIGRERTILLGSVLSAIGAGSILVYALTFEHKAPEVLWVLFAFLNTGVGIRGPGGFFMAIFASKNNNARATAIVLLMMFLLVAGTTALVAPFIASGLIPLALATTTLCAASLLIMWLIPGLPDDDFNTEKNISG